MKKSSILLSGWMVWLLFCLFCSQLPAQPISSDVNLENQILKAFSYYDEGRIAEAENLAYRLLSEESKMNARQKHDLYRLLAFCAIANDDEEAGLRLFVSALRFNPTMTSDMLTWSPKIRRVFENARGVYQSQLEKERRLLLSSDADLGRRSSLRSLYFPGSGQFMKGQPVRGVLLGTLFWSSCSYYLYEWAALPEVRDRYHQAETSFEAHQRWEEYRDHKYMVNISGLVTLAIYSYTYFDALWSASGASDSLKAH